MPEELETYEIIKSVVEHTGWISNLVPTPKSDPKEIRMNVNMTTANLAIKHTRHIILTLEELQYQLTVVAHFSKIDMKHGYMQFELDPALHHITIFHTHQSLSWSRRLTFGINSEAEIFHKEVHQTLGDISTLAKMYGHIIIYGHTADEHNLVLCHTIQRSHDCSLTLNKNKCIFDKPSIQFFGVIFSKDGLSPAPDKIAALKKSTPPTNAADFWVSLISGYDKFYHLFHPRLLNHHCPSTSSHSQTWRT